MFISTKKKVKWGEGWRVLRWGCLRWGVREDFSEAAAFELRAKGSEGVGHGATRGERVLCTQRQVQRPGDRSEPDCAQKEQQDGKSRRSEGPLGGDVTGQVGRAENNQPSQNHSPRSPDTAPRLETSSPPRAPAAPLGPCSHTVKQRAVSGAALRLCPGP